MKNFDLPKLPNVNNDKIKELIIKMVKIFDNFVIFINYLSKIPNYQVFYYRYLIIKSSNENFLSIKNDKVKNLHKFCILSVSIIIIKIYKNFFNTCTNIDFYSLL